MTNIIINMEYNKAEENTFRKDLFRRLDNQDDILKEIKAQTTKTNGRATVLETRLDDYEKIKDTVSSLSGFKMWLTGAVAVILLCGSTIGYLFSQVVLNSAKNDTEELIRLHEKDINTKLDIFSATLQEYDKIIIEN